MDEDELKKIKKYFIIGIVFAVIAPYLLTRCLGIVSFMHTGEIGDTIGGITAPITSLIGSILVFYALKAQVEANKLIRNEQEGQKKENLQIRKSEYIAEQVRLVRDDINDFRFTEVTRSIDLSSSFKEYQGAGAISKFISYLINVNLDILVQNMTSSERLAKIAELWMLLQVIKKLKGQIDREDLLQESKAYYISSLSYQFHSKVRPPFDDVPAKGKEGELNKLFALVSELESIFPPESFQHLDNPRL